MYGNNYFRTLRKLHKLISVSLTNLLCILGSGTRPLTPSPCHVIFPIQNPAQSRHKYSYLRILGNTSDKEGKDTTTLIFPPLHAPASHFLPHPRSNINATLRISDRKITEILEIKIFHHRFQQKCYQPTTFPYLILQTLIKSSVLISTQYKNYHKIARAQKYYNYCINNRNT